MREVTVKFSDAEWQTLRAAAALTGSGMETADIIRPAALFAALCFLQSAAATALRTVTGKEEPAHA